MKKLLHPIAKLFSSSSKSIKSEIRERAIHKYPDDFEAQKYIYKEELAAYNYMETVGDHQIKEFVNKHYPANYSMQKYIYNKQLEAKKYMESVSDHSAKEQAIKKYPKDYSTQKYIYDNTVG